MIRVLLFVLTNLAIMLTLSIAAYATGANRYFTEYGLDLQSLALYSAIFGCGGAFISLLMSKWAAKFATGAVVIDAPADATESFLLNCVRNQAQLAGIPVPELAIFESQDPNAFATGATRSNSLVALSTGLVHCMDRNEIEAVIAHEISHIANGDMVTMTLLQGVLNAFVIFASRFIGFAVDKAVFKSEDGRGPGYAITYLILDLVFGLIASLVVMAFSRSREYRADAGSAKLVGKHKMISALARLQSAHDNQLPAPVAAFGIHGSGPKFLALFASHPSIEERIEALQKL